MTPLRRGDAAVLQLNIGLYCNQACSHCHVESSPLRTEAMDDATAARCIELLRRLPPRYAQLDRLHQEWLQALRPVFPYRLHDPRVILLGWMTEQGWLFKQVKVEDRWLPCQRVASAALLQCWAEDLRVRCGPCHSA